MFSNGENFLWALRLLPVSLLLPSELLIPKMTANVSSPFSVATASEVWYFAYGSNMRPSVMTNRGLSPLATEKALIPSHVLTFDVFGVPYSEPAMASIAEGPTSSICESYGDSSKIPPVHGIAYLLPLAEYKNLVISEGAGIAYRESELTGCLLAAQGIHGNVQRKIVMRTLVAKYPFRPNAAPSKRYLVSITHHCTFGETFVPRTASSQQVSVRLTLNHRLEYLSGGCART